MIFFIPKFAYTHQFIKILIYDLFKIQTWIKFKIQPVQYLYK